MSTAPFNFKGKTMNQLHRHQRIYHQRHTRFPGFWSMEMRIAWCPACSVCKCKMHTLLSFWFPLSLCFWLQWNRWSLENLLTKATWTPHFQAMLPGTRAGVVNCAMEDFSLQCSVLSAIQPHSEDCFSLFCYFLVTWVFFFVVAFLFVYLFFCFLYFF